MTRSLSPTTKNPGPRITVHQQSGQIIFNQAAIDALNLRKGDMVDVRLNQRSMSDWWLVKSPDSEGIPLAEMKGGLLGFRGSRKVETLMRHFLCEDAWLALDIDTNPERDGDCVGYGLVRAHDEEEPTAKGQAA